MQAKSLRPAGVHPQACSAVVQSFLWFLCLGAWFASPALADVSRDFNGGVYLYKRGDFELAAKTFELILTEHPNHPRTDEVLYWYGETKFQLEKYEDALDIYKKLAAEYPKSKFKSKADLSAGYAAMKIGLDTEAVMFFSAVAADPTTTRDILIECRILLAECFIKEGNDKAAEQVLRDLLAMPKVPPEQRQEAEFELGKLLMRQGRSTEGLSLFARVAEKSGPHQAEAFMALGDAAYAEGKYFQGLEWYEKVMRQARGAPQSFLTRAIYNGAWSYLGLGQSGRALALFEEVLEDRNAPPEVRGDAALRMAQIFREKGKHTQAGEHAAQAMKIAEDSGLVKLVDEVLLFYAESAFLQKKYDESLAFLARVTDKAYRFLRLTGQIFFESGRTPDAISHFERAALAAPNRNAANLCFFDLAKSHFVSGAFDTALTSLERIKDPNQELKARMPPFRADALLQAGKFKEAARQYEKLTAETPDTRTAQRYRYFAALASFQAKSIAQADKYLETFITISDMEKSARVKGVSNAEEDSIFAAAVLLRADVLARQKQYEEAQAMYLRATAAAKPVGPDELYMAYSHFIDFSTLHDKDHLAERVRDFVSELGDTRTFLFVIARLYEVGRYKDLLTHTSEILQKFPEAAGIYGKAIYYRMMAYYKLEQIPAAAEIQEALAKWLAANASPELSDESDFWRARIAQTLSDRPRAKSAYLAYLDLHPTGKYGMEAHLNLGILALENGQAVVAEREFLKLLAGRSEEDTLADTLLIDVRYNLASVRILQGRHSEAAAMLEKIETLDPYKSDAACFYKLGYVYVTLGRTVEAESQFRTAISQKNISAGVLDNTIFALLSLLYQSERYADLEKDFKRYAGRIQDRTSAARAQYLMGMVLFNSERYPEAAPFFQVVAPTGDTELDIEASMRLGDCNYNMKRYQEALDQYGKISEDFLSTKWGREALYAAGLCKVKLGILAGALEEFERFLRDHPAEPLAPDVALEAARVYLSLGNLDRAEDKLDFLERHKAQEPFLEESLRLRIRIWQRRGNADKVIELAKSHRASFGPNSEVSVAAAESAIKLGRAQDAVMMLEGFSDTTADIYVRASMDFYRAEALQMLGRGDAMELYQKLLDSPDTEIRLASRFRYGLFSMSQKDYARARGVFGSILSDPSGKHQPFFQESILNALAASKESGEAREVARIYEAFKKDILEEKSKIGAAEYNLWAHLTLKDNPKSLQAIEDFLTLSSDAGRRTEVLLISAQIHETLKNLDRADTILSSVMKNPEAPDDLRQTAESRKVNLAISRGAAGRPILEAYLSGGPKSVWGRRAAEALLGGALEEKRYDEVIRVGRLMQSKLGSVTPEARYALAVAHLSLSDTPSAFDQFQKIADGDSPDTFHIAWSAYRLAQDDLLHQRLPQARSYLQTAWRWRTAMDSGATSGIYRQLMDVLFQLSDAKSLKSLAEDSPPRDRPEGPNLLKGLAAWLTKDYPAAAKHLKEVPQASDEIQTLFAESLKLSADTPAAIAVYKKLAEGEGVDAGRARLKAAMLYGSIGKTAEGLIEGYKVLAEYESDTDSDLGAEALLTISKLYAKTGDKSKSRDAALELIKKYPRSRLAKEARTLTGGR